MIEIHFNVKRIKKSVTNCFICKDRSTKKIERKLKHWKASKEEGGKEGGQLCGDRRRTDSGWCAHNATYR